MGFDRALALHNDYFWIFTNFTTGKDETVWMAGYAYDVIRVSLNLIRRRIRRHEELRVSLSVVNHSQAGSRIDNIPERCVE